MKVKVMDITTTVTQGEVEAGRLHSDIEVDVSEGKSITLPSNFEASVRTDLIKLAVASSRARDGDDGGGGGGETGGAGEPSRVGERSRRRAGFEIAARARDGGGREDACGARGGERAEVAGRDAGAGVRVGKGRRESWTIAAVLLRDVNKCTTMCERVVVVFVVVVVPYPRERVRATIAGVRRRARVTVRTSRRCRRTVAERRVPPASAA